MAKLLAAKEENQYSVERGPTFHRKIAFFLISNTGRRGKALSLYLKSGLYLAKRKPDQLPAKKLRKFLEIVTGSCYSVDTFLIPGAEKRVTPMKGPFAMAEIGTTQLQHCLDRLRAGDESARDELLQCARERLIRLTRKMLKGYRRVKRWEDTDDVLQNALLRLCRSLQETTPHSVRDFFRLAALQIRRELIDLARHYFGPQGHGAKHASNVNKAHTPDTPLPAYEKCDDTNDPSRLATWTEFHQQVSALSDDDKEMFDLLWYQGLSQEETAALLNASVRTIQRRWQSARLKMHRALKGELPGS
jgi:RNA polymerase sigma-70 factor (ECF subfamily)